VGERQIEGIHPEIKSVGVDGLVFGMELIDFRGKAVELVADRYDVDIRDGDRFEADALDVRAEILDVANRVGSDDLGLAMVYFDLVSWRKWVHDSLE